MKPIIVFTLVGIFMTVVPIDARSFSFPGKPVRELGSIKRSLQFDSSPLSSTPAKNEDDSNDATPEKSQLVLVNSHRKTVSAENFFHSRYKGQQQNDNGEENVESSVNSDIKAEKSHPSSSASSSEENNNLSAHASIENRKEDEKSVKNKNPQTFLPLDNAPGLNLSPNLLAEGPEAQASPKTEHSRAKRELITPEVVKLNPRVRKVSKNLAQKRKELYKRI